MRTKTHITLILAALLAYWVGLCNVSAFYDPGTQRWLNRDPIDENGFVLVRTGYQLPRFAPLLFAAARRPLDMNAFGFVGNDPEDRYDPFGMDSQCSNDCAKAPPLKDDSSACDAYGGKSYRGAGLSCFCKCAGNSDWSQKVRGCLACEFKKGTPTDEAHHKCYDANGGTLNGPVLTLAWCLISCQLPLITPSPPYNIPPL
jgi:hypothetical protein